MKLVEKHIISKTHFNYKVFDELCFISKNLYNQANYIVRQEFTKNNLYLKYRKVDKIVKTLEDHNNYKLLLAQMSQQVLRLLDKNWLSFFRSIKDWSKNKDKYLGKPKLPKYKKKDGRNIIIFTNQTVKLRGCYIHFPKRFNIKAMKTKVDNICQVRICPRGSNYIMEVVYEKKIIDNDLDHRNVIGIDLGINNFVTVTNNNGITPFIINGKILKSYNQYFNKKRSKLMSSIGDRGLSNKIIKLTNKRSNKLEDFFHKTSKFIIQYCLHNNVGTIVVGKNDNWKQKVNLGKRNNQKFSSIAYDTFINKLKYKAELQSINLIITEESYTSKCSFIDKEEIKFHTNYKGKRIKRGLFKTASGSLVNADVNGSYNIIRKVFPDFKYDGIEGVGLHPFKINIF